MSLIGIPGAEEGDFPQPFNIETDPRLFHKASPNPCSRCGRKCTYIAHGMHIYVCSEGCLRAAAEEFIVRRGLKDWAKADLSPREESEE